MSLSVAVSEATFLSDELSSLFQSKKPFRKDGNPFEHKLM
jgi:hypothetical protein